MKRRIIVGLATVITVVAAFVAQASAASACVFWVYDPELPDSLK